MHSNSWSKNSSASFEKITTGKIYSLHPKINAHLTSQGVTFLKFNKIYKNIGKSSFLTIQL
jgi:hypothetical protein